MAIISFVFPFYNEEKTLPLLIKRIRQVMAKEPEDYEMIFVNDSSKDNSVKAIEQEAKSKEKGKIVLVNMSRRWGVEESFMAGIHTAQGDAIILMYTDMQDPPEMIPQMLASFREGAEIVHTLRRKRIGEHPLKNVAAFLAYRIIGKLSDIKIPYDSGEFKLISKKVAHHLLACPESEPYLRGLIPWIGFKQSYIPYDLQPRIAGDKKVPLFGKKAWTVFLNGIISFSDFLIYLILLIGLGGLIFSWGGCLWAIGHGKSDMIFFGVIFLWASLMTALGFLGLYISKIYKNVRRRPSYIIQEVVKF